jgi:hypothetical protein
MPPLCHSAGGRVYPYNYVFLQERPLFSVLWPDHHSGQDGYGRGEAGALSSGGPDSGQRLSWRCLCRKVACRGTVPATRPPLAADQKRDHRPSRRGQPGQLLAAVGEDNCQENGDLQDDQHRVHRDSFDPIAFPCIRHVAEARSRNRSGQKGNSIESIGVTSASGGRDPRDGLRGGHSRKVTVGLCRLVSQCDLREVVTSGRRRIRASGGQRSAVR